MRRFTALLLALLLISLASWGGPQKRDLSPFLVIHKLPGELERPDIEYRGVCGDSHMFVSTAQNALLLSPMRQPAEVRKFFFRRGGGEGEILSPSIIASFGDRIWIADNGNRVSVFQYKEDSLIPVGTAFIPGLQNIGGLLSTSTGLYVFGMDMSGTLKLLHCFHNGSSAREIDSFGETVPGNIIMGSDDAGKLYYLFQFDSKARVYDGKKTRKIRVAKNIRYSQKDHKKSGVLYNIGGKGDYLFTTYWTITEGGTLSIMKDGKLFAVTDYPLGKGFFNNGSLYIHRFSFQDKKQVSFIVEVRTYDIIK